MLPKDTYHGSAPLVEKVRERRTGENRPTDKVSVGTSGRARQEQASPNQEMLSSTPLGPSVPSLVTRVRARSFGFNDVVQPLCKFASSNESAPRITR
jgi:hypothetical protein